MITYTYSEARAKLADVLDTAIDQPVTITRRTSPDLVIISKEQFTALQQVRFDVALGRASARNRETLKTLADK